MFNLKISTLCICCTGFIALISPTFAEKQYAIPKKSFNISYPLSFPEQKLYHGKSFPLKGRTGNHFFILYDFGGEKHTVRLNRLNSAKKVIGKPQNKVFQLEQMVQTTFEKGYILFEPHVPLEIVADIGKQIKIVIEKGNKKGLLTLDKKYFEIRSKIPENKRTLGIQTEGLVEIRYPDQESSEADPK